MKWLIVMLLTVACGTAIVQDNAPSPIEEGQKRVETIICDGHAVGENGCLFADGVIDSSLKIFKIYSGELTIFGLGCGVEYSASYVQDGNPWLELDLKELVGKEIDNDCVLTITQKVSWDGGQTAPFPIKSFRGTVTLATCPSGVKCSMSYEQRRVSDQNFRLKFDLETQGRFTLSGCGEELIPPTNYLGTINIGLAQFLPNKPDTGCMFILALIGKDKHKIYHKAWTYSDKVIPIPLPQLTMVKNKVFFTLPESVLAVSVDGRITRKKFFLSLESGNYLRFYTSQGRSLIMFIKEGRLVWAK